MNNKLDVLISKSSGLRTCSSLRRSRSPKQVGEKDVELVVGASEKSQNSEKVKFGEVGHIGQILFFKQNNILFFSV